MSLSEVEETIQIVSSESIITKHQMVQVVSNTLEIFVLNAKSLQTICYTFPLSVSLSNIVKRKLNLRYIICNWKSIEDKECSNQSDNSKIESVTN